MYELTLRGFTREKRVEMCVCLWQTLSILRWSCTVDRMLKSSYWLEGAPGTFAFQVCEVQFWWSDSCTQLSKNTVKEDVPTQSLYCLPAMQPTSLCTKFCLLNWPHVCSSYWDQFSRLLKVSGVAGFIFVCDFIVLLNWGQNQWWRLGLWISCFEGPQEECCILLGS